MAATTKRRLMAERELTPLPHEDEGRVSEASWSAFEPEEGTLARIIYLLAAPDIGRLGSLTRLSEESGISRVSLTRIVLLARDGTPVHPTDGTFQKLNALLDDLDPPLTELGDVRPIRFEDWYALKRFHNSSQAGEDVSGSETEDLIHQIVALSPEQQEMVLRYIRKISKTANPVTLGRQRTTLREIIKDLGQEAAAMAINNLARLILFNAANRKVSMNELAEILAGDDLEDAPRLREGLEQIIKGVLPDDLLLLTELARVLITPDGGTFGGDVDQLLHFCGLNQKKHLANNGH